FGLRVFGSYRIGEALQAVNAGNQDVLQASILQLSQHGEPEFGTFGFGQPQAQQLLLAFHVDAERQVHGLVDNALVLANFQDNAVEVDDRVDRVNGAILPLYDGVEYAVGDLGNQRCRDIGIVHFLEGRNDVTGAHALRVERQDLVIHLRQAGLALANELRLEGAGTVAWRVNLDLAVLALQAFGRGAVAAVARATASGIVLVVAQMLVELGAQRRLHSHLHQLLRQVAEIGL